MSLFAIRSGRSIAVAALFGAALAVMPLQSAFAQPSDMPAKAMSGKTMHDAGKGEQRIKNLHEKLHITPAQEELWGNLAKTMSDNDKTLKASWDDQKARGKTMNAVDSLKFKQIMADQHSSGLKQLVPQFEALYAALTPEQKKQADQAFAKHQHGEDRRRCDRK